MAFIDTLSSLRVATRKEAENIMEDCCKSQLEQTPPKSVADLRTELEKQVVADPWKSQFIVNVGVYTIPETPSGLTDFHCDCLRTHISAFYGQPGLDVVVHRRCTAVRLEADVFVQCTVPEPLADPQPIVSNQYLPPYDMPALVPMEDEPTHPSFLGSGDHAPTESS